MATSLTSKIKLYRCGFLKYNSQEVTSETQICTTPSASSEFRPQQAHWIGRKRPKDCRKKKTRKTRSGSQKRCPRSVLGLSPFHLWLQSLCHQHSLLRDYPSKEKKKVPHFHFDLIYTNNIPYLEDVFPMWRTLFERNLKGRINGIDWVKYPNYSGLTYSGW